MKILFSINQKVFDNSPQDIIWILKKYDVNHTVAGFEICFDIHNENHIRYVEEMAVLCKKNNYILQFHGDSNLDIKTQKQYLKILNHIAQIMETRMPVVLHPISSDTIEKMIEQSNLYFSKILNDIYRNHLKVSISIENLNSSSVARLSKEYLKPILANNMDLNFTYDIGHEDAEYGKVIDLDPILIDRICNVHIHTFHNINDHLPIGVDSNREWIKGLQYLKTIRFENTLVLEYDIYKLGNNFDERIKNYIKGAEFLYEYL